MTFVPGFSHDIFISYAHGDARDWINRFVDRLKPTIRQHVGMEPNIWIDKENLSLGE